MIETLIELEPVKTHSTVLILTLGMALLACRRSSERQGNVHENEASGKSTALAPRAGQTARWVMPETMMQHIRNLEVDVRALESSEAKDHAELATKIEGHTRQLISDCTMEGEAHDVLHDWLMPFLQLNKDYALAPDSAAKEARFKDIQKALATFHERFE